VAHGAEDCGDIAMGKAADNLQGVVRGYQRIAAEHPPQGVELGGRPMCEIGQSPGFDLSVLSVAFAQQDRRW
jgi:hypothetical protein